MKGHIRKRGVRSWAIVLDLGRDAAGKRKQKWHSVRGSKKDAEAELARLVHEMNTGSYVEPSKMPVRDYLDRWLKNYGEQSVSPKTLERYREIIESHIKPAIGGYVLSKLMPLHIQSFYTEALTSGRKDGTGGLSPQTVLHFHRLLHHSQNEAAIVAKDAALSVALAEINQLVADQSLEGSNLPAGAMALPYSNESMTYEIIKDIDGKYSIHTTGASGPFTSSAV